MAFLLRKCPTTSIIQRSLHSTKYITPQASNDVHSHHNGKCSVFIDPLEQQSERHMNLQVSDTRKVCKIYPNIHHHQNNSTYFNLLEEQNNTFNDLQDPKLLAFSIRSSQNSNKIVPMSPSSMVNRARILMWSSSIQKISNFGTEHQYRERKHEKHWNGHQRSRKLNYKNSMLWSLGVLGVFKRMTSDDIEEEKRKLTDEEKVKKMTPAELLIAKGVLSLCDFEYDKADSLFHEALHLTQKDQNAEQETLVLNLMATNYFDSGRFEEAEKLFIDLIKRLIALDMEPSDPAILELSLKLSSIYSKNVKHHSKAFRGFEFVINSLLYSLQDLLKDLQEVDVLDISEQQRNDLALLGWAYDWFARHLINMNDYVGAVDMLRRALDISTKILGPKHDQTLILLNDVGTTLAMVNQAEEGRDYIKRAVEGALESQSRELASFYVNLGLVNLQLRKLEEAKRYCEYSIELASKNASHHNTTEILTLSQNCLDEVKRLLQVQTNQ